MPRSPEIAQYLSKKENAIIPSDFDDGDSAIQSFSTFPSANDCDQSVIDGCNGCLACAVNYLNFVGRQRRTSVLEITHDA